MFRVAVSRNLRRWLALLLLLLGLQQLAGAALIKAKAWLAPVLIETAWAQTLARGGEPVKPWSWADTWPVARLRAPAQEVELLVLAGDSGNALAFGPGHATASATLGSAGLAVIGGHRDTHFAFLRDLPVGALLRLELPDGRWRSYAVESSRVVDASRELLPTGLAEEVLLLVTCYPFDALQANGPLRYVVRAIPIAAGDQDPRVAGPAAS
jgi:sortase A